MATAGRLGRAGYKVTVLEKNDTIGGRCQSRHVAAPGVDGGEFRFDTGALQLRGGGSPRARRRLPRSPLAGGVSEHR